MKIFEQVQVRKPKKNKFDLSHERKLTFDFGFLYPILCLECVPGDSFRVHSDVFLRTMALIAPVMHKVNVTVHYYKVPYRLLWNSWEDFITGGREGISAPSFPKMQLGDINTTLSAFLKPGSLLDHLGFPVLDNAVGFNAGTYGGVQFGSLPVKAYQLIYDTFYRDQNLEASILPAAFKADGVMPFGDNTAHFTLRKRAWPKDFFNSCLPWTQRGAEVTIPVNSVVTYRKPSVVRNAATDILETGATFPATQAGTAALLTTGGPSGANQPAYLDNIASISASNFTINALRTSWQLQVWLENNARGGARYIEQIKHHFGVVSSDARLQRPEYLGGGKAPIIISEVLQHSSPAGTTPLGTMAGHGIAVANSNRFTTYCEEHSFVMGVLSVIPETAYQQAMPPIFWRQVNTDFYFPEFAHLGEYAVRQLNVYYNMGDPAAVPGAIFGYQSRYAEYKWIQSSVHGSFRDTLLFWHLGIKFAAAPALNTAFVQCSPRNDIFAVPAEPNKLMAQIFHRIDALRPMPYFGTPSGIA